MTEARTKVVGVAVDADGYTDTFEIAVERRPSWLSDTRNPKPTDLPGDVREALRLWLAGEQS